jgi:hypothetical protein
MSEFPKVFTPEYIEAFRINSQKAIAEFQQMQEENEEFALGDWWDIATAAVNAL